MSTSLLHRCIILATESHAGQVDKAGEPYILHPLRVMCDPTLTTEVERCVSVLHDVVEDCPETRDLPLWVPHDVRWRVKFLTRSKSMPYDQYIQEISDYGDPIVIRVKLADIRDNTDPIRSKGVTDIDLLAKLFSLRQKYDRARLRLEEALNNVNHREREKILETATRNLLERLDDEDVNGDVMYDAPDGYEGERW